ncbi:transcription elongation factor GreA [Levilactobacillus bambusae]|uniref:Transcription elongation factor GreA n=1 Tax=Levilactobacillus bambusae TaxID=2024736 RepID=A0A2V1MZ10_9LACO|nr:transcription elongation factor GreA [Levilactobacillus bambusae]PWG00251.1 transcription elongation factor GreA [Levilactobacillus bambusae]
MAQDPELTPITRAGYEHVVAEINDLKLNKRPGLLKQLSAAAALGDRSENSEYTSAKHDLRQMEGRLRYLDKIMTYADIIEPAENDLASIGKTVTIQFMDDESTETYQLVGPTEADLEHGKLTIASPIGRKLNGQPAGTIVSVDAPNGAYQVKLTNVTLP